MGDYSEALCRMCKCKIPAHHMDLKQHVSNEKHKKSAAPFSTMRQSSGLGTEWDKKLWAEKTYVARSARI